MKLRMTIIALMLLLGGNQAIAQCQASFSMSLSGPTITFTNTSSNYNLVSWDYGDSTTSNTLASVHSHTYTTTGIKTVVLTIEDTTISCIDTILDTIFVSVPPPPCNASFVDSISGSTVYFTNTSTNAVYNTWYFGDGTSNSQYSPSHTYSAPGLYTVCLVIADSFQTCTDSFCLSVLIPSSSSCNAQFNHADTGLAVTFTNASTSSFSTSTWFWTFGDGSTSTLKDPKHTYGSSGSYTVCLVMTDSNFSCVDSVCKTITVQAPCNITALFSHQSSGLTAFFSNQSIADSTATYVWNFGNGQFSTQKHPTHTYLQAGTYVVCLTVVDSIKGCSDSYCDTLQISNSTPCKASFTYQVVGNTVQFINSSTGTTQYNWDFGDQNSSRQKNPSHTYTANGLYTVCLTAWDSIAMCSDTICDTVRIQGPGTGCLASFNIFPDTLNPGKYNFINTSTPNNPFMSYSWVFSDGSLYGTKNVSKTVTTPGTYQACLFIYDSLSGCSDSTCLNFTFTIPSNCSAGFTYAHNGQAIQFFNTSIPQSPSAQWNWSFGDNSIGSNQKDPQHVYSASGTYTVCLILSDSITNCTDTFCDTVLVQSQPGCLANFTSKDSIANLVQFTNHSIATSGNAGYIWDFGYGPKSWATHPLHLFPKAGAYQVCLMVVDSSSPGGFCADSICQTVYVGSMGIDESPEWNKDEITVYPNPFDQSLNIRLPGHYNGEELEHLNIYDLTGRIVAFQDQPEVDSNGQVRIELGESDLRPGMYYLEVSTGKQNLLFPVYKQ